MASKYCSACIQKLPLSLFLKDASNPSGKVLATCIACQGKSKSKRKALQELHPNAPLNKRATACTRLKPSIPPPNLSESRPEATILPNPHESRLEATISALPKSRPKPSIPPP